MKHVCPRCSQKVLEYGIPHYLLLERACVALMRKEFLVFDDFLPFDFPVNLTGQSSVREVLNHLELHGYLLSTEVSTIHIAIIPNIRRAWFHPEIEAFCWCPQRREVFQ